ncbi:MAG: hypothetical protein SWE60_05960 [Thermodesulfobacteriota bacterium]|nr:hypothetical protein [Thermodesulfobacteriota bacterium]
MQKSATTGGGLTNRLQILIGFAVLLVGTFVYLTDRPPDHIYFLSIGPAAMSFYGAVPHLFGPIGNSLPSFAHVFSVILITAGVLSCHKKGYLIICSAWLLVDCAFEWGQKSTAWCSGMIPDCFSNIPFLENIETYFLNGTFDPVDVVAILIGTLTAYMVLIKTDKTIRRQNQ